MQRIYLLFIFFMLGSFTMPDGREWILKKNENGIAVYIRNTEGSNIKEIRVVNKVKSTFGGIIGLLLDTKNYPNWIASCTEGSTLKVISPTEIYKYQYTSAPITASDRDEVSDFKISQNPKTKVITITDVSLPDYIPAKKGVVRIKNFKAHYTITKLKDGSVNIDYELFVDPGGAVPTWLVNANLIDVPYKNTVSMMKQLPKYQAKTYSFIKE